MSLFKAREWWSTSCGVEEVFDQASLCVSNLGKGDNDVIIVGSHAGVLRVFCPSLPEAENSPGFTPKDLVIETHLPNPILQLQVGRFISGSAQSHIAVLHPQCVAVYSLVVRAGSTDHGEQSALVAVYEHQLKKSAYGLVAGPFGGVKGRDFLCVQSLDGTLSFFEQETFVFSRQLPDFLLPGPLIFIATTDAFVTCNSHFNVESYRYQALAEASNASDKHLAAEWSLNIGESAIDMACVAYSENEVDVFVLGEHNLFCIRDRGTLKFMRRFEFQPSCFHVYRTEGLVMVLLSTDTGTLLVLNNSTLRWSAQLPMPPAALSRASLQGMEGVIVLLSDSGVIQCCYLGTEPSLFVAPSVEPRPIDYQEAEKELNHLSSVVRAFHDSSSLLTVNMAVEKELKLNIKPSQHPETRGEAQVCYIAIDLQPHPAHAPLNKVQVTIVPQPPLAADPPSHTISSLCEDYQVASYVVLKSGTSELVWSLEVSVLVSYMTGSGVPRVIHASCQLPLRLVVSPSAPTKDAEIKVTLNTNFTAVSLSDLFPEFNTTGVGPHALGFSFHSSVVTLLAAKMSTRYRLQSDSFYPLALIIKQLVSRLERYEKSTDRQIPLKLTSLSPLPLQQLFQEIQNHFDARKLVNSLQDQLAHLSVQFRAIERRLLSKMKDKKPTPLNQLDTLLFASQEEIISTSFSLEKAQESLKSSQCQVSCVVELLHLLLLSSSADLEACASFHTALSPYFSESEDHGWEDYTYAAIQCFLKLMPSAPKQSPSHSSSSRFETVADITHMSKLISAAVEGLSVVPAHDSSNEEVRKVISPIHELSEVEEELPVPAGSRFAEIRGASAPRRPTSLLTRSDTPSHHQKDATSGRLTQDHDDDVWI